MKLKQIALFSTIAVFLLLVTGKSLYMYIQGQKDYKRILASQQNLTKQLVYYKDKQGHETAKTPVLQYTKKELDNVLPDVNTLLKTLKIKPKQTESVAEIATTQHKDIITRLYDFDVFGVSNLRIGQTLGKHFVLGVANNPAEFLVDVQKPSVNGNSGDTDGGVFKHGTVALLIFCQGILNSLAFFGF